MSFVRVSTQCRMICFALFRTSKFRSNQTKEQIHNVIVYHDRENSIEAMFTQTETSSAV